LFLRRARRSARSLSSAARGPRSESELAERDYEFEHNNRQFERQVCSRALCAWTECAFE